MYLSLISFQDSFWLGKSLNFRVSFVPLWILNHIFQT